MRHPLLGVVLALPALILAHPLSAETIEIAANKDNTLYEDLTGSFSNGGGSLIFMGRVGSNGLFKLRRAVVSFDLSGIPANAKINSVSIAFTINQVPALQQDPSSGVASLHRLQKDWGEGTTAPIFGPEGQGAPSEPGDVSWIHRFYDTDDWSTAGGDFDLTASASTGFGTSNPETMIFTSTPRLVADVQSWLSDPVDNFGWILIGDETPAPAVNARGLASREAEDNAGPVLTVDYTIESVTDHLVLNLLTTDLLYPVSVAHAGEGSERLFIVEQRGVVRIYDLASNTLLPTAFLNIESDVFSLEDIGGGAEQGLLGMAFHPKYKTNGKFYLSYTVGSLDNPSDSVVAEFQVSANPDVALPNGQVILQFPQDASNHNGGDLHFGWDGYLYIASGDGGGKDDQYDNGQNIHSLKGAILRIDVDGSAPSGGELCDANARYGIPSGNAFPGSNDGCDEILHFGLRNPWRFSFDAMTGDLYIADVGQRDWEEVNFLPKRANGANLGWSCREGAHDFPGNICISETTDPVIEYPHVQGNCSITGGYVYRGDVLPLRGRYLYGDWCTARVWIASRSGNTWSSEEWLATSNTLKTLVSFAQDARCNLYLLDRNAEEDGEDSYGALYRIDDSNQVFNSGFEAQNCR